MSIRKYRKCPHCGSKKGFQITVFLGGNMEYDVDFNGTILNSNRNGIDDIENYATCLECGRLIDSEKLDTDNI